MNTREGEKLSVNQEASKCCALSPCRTHAQTACLTAHCSCVSTQAIAEPDLQQLFAPFGNIESVQVVRDTNGKSSVSGVREGLEGSGAVGQGLLQLGWGTVGREARGAVGQVQLGWGRAAQPGRITRTG